MVDLISAFKKDDLGREKNDCSATFFLFCVDNYDSQHFCQKSDQCNTLCQATVLYLGHVPIITKNVVLKSVT